jgi:hypothetical protein
VSTSRLLSLAWVLVVFSYVLRLLLATDPVTEEVWSDLFRGERGILDRAEAVLWVPAIILNVLLLLAALKAKKTSLRTAWFLGMSALLVFLFGEEISWGQYIFGFEPPAVMEEINAQQELNLHTLNLSFLLGIPSDSPLYPLLSNFNHILNPAFYLFCCVLFIGIPVAKRTGMFAVLDDIPVPNWGIVVFFTANVLAYLIVDKLIVDVGEIFEFGIVSTFALTSLDIYRHARATWAAKLPTQKVIQPATAS